MIWNCYIMITKINNIFKFFDCIFVFITNIVFLIARNKAIIFLSVIIMIDCYDFS